MILLDGKAAAAAVKEEIKKEIAEHSYNISLAVIVVGTNPASAVYVSSKEKDAIEVGMKSIVIRLEETISQEELNNEIIKLNNDSSVHGILVQFPLPKHLSESKVINLIAPQKDVDGFSPYQAGKLAIGEGELISCTPYGVIRLLKHFNIPIKGKNAVIVGRSNIVGKPLFHLLLQNDATVTVCHSRTEDIKSITKNADILIAAVGKANFITEDMVKDGAVVVDVGINRFNDKLVGDVDFTNVSQKCAAISPVPGGVGLMTRAMLLVNTLNAFKLSNGK